MQRSTDARLYREKFPQGRIAQGIEHARRNKKNHSQGSAQARGVLPRPRRGCYVNLDVYVYVVYVSWTLLEASTDVSHITWVTQALGTRYVPSARSFWEAHRSSKGFRSLSRSRIAGDMVYTTHATTHRQQPHPKQNAKKPRQKPELPRLTWPAMPSMTTSLTVRIPQP